jgi:hypothetical protein
MKAKIISLFVSMLLIAVTAASVTGTDNIDRVDENSTPYSYAPTMAPGDIVIDFDAQTAHGETGVLGAEWDGEYFWTTSRGLVNPPHKIFVWDIDGNLVQTYNQPAQSSAWGIRDLAFDGTYLYGGSENGFWQIDPSDGTTTLMFSSIAPMTIIRALAWEPNEGMFYTGSFGLGWFKFTPDGSTITPVTNPGLTAVYGMAYDDYNDVIWVFDQVGTPQTTISEYDHHTGTLTGNSYLVPLLTGLTAQLAGGLFYAEDVTGYVGTAILGGMVQGTALDRLFCMDHGTVNTPPNIPDTPDGPDNGATGVTYTFTTTTTDPEGEDVYYKFDWGDGTISDWFGPFASGATGEGDYSWTTSGIFDVRVKAKDVNDGESDWSAAHQIDIAEGPIMEIKPLSTSFFKVKATIKNAGAVEATDVPWTISLDGGAFIGAESSGTIASIPAGGEVEVQSGLVIGLGATTVTVTADVSPGVSDIREQSGTVILFIIMIKPGGG